MPDLLMIAGIIAVGMICQWIAWRITIPAILPLLAAGFLAGPILDWLHPQAALGELFYPFVSLAVAIILFEGALTLNWREVRSVAATVRNLITVGAAITWAGGALAARLLIGLPWALALLFGALIIVTGPTVITPLLRNVRPTAKVTSVLRWESILIDPIGATVAVLVYDFTVAEAGAGFDHTVQILLWIVLVGTALGLAGGYAVYQLLHRYLVPDYLRDPATLALVLLVFAVSNTLGSESGLLAVTVMGVYLANTDLRQLRELFYFKEKLSVLLISTLFILLAANVTRGDLALLDWRSLLVLGVVLLVLRPLAVWVSAAGSELNRNEQLFLAWIAPRGIVAAAVSSLFAFELVNAGYSAARLIAPLTFLIIVGTVVLQGGTAKWVARRLGVREADPQGFLLMGANWFAQELALTLQEQGFVVRLVDANATNVREARLRGLAASHGNLLSDFLETNIDLSGIGRLLALTNNDEANALVCKHFEAELGSAQVYQLPPQIHNRAGGGYSETVLGRVLFGEDASYRRITALLDAGATIKMTPLTAQFDWAEFQARYSDADVIPMFQIKGQQVEIGTSRRPLQPGPGWTVISLVREPAAPTSVAPDPNRALAQVAAAS